MVRGRRDTVVCYNPITDEHEVLENVLFRDSLVGRYATNNTQSNHHNNHNASSPSAQRVKGDANNINHCSNGRQNSTSSKTKSSNNDTITTAFWPIPYKAKIQTIMGHVEYVFHG